MLKISLLTLLDLNVAHCKTVITKSFYEQCLLYNINLLIFYCIYYWTLIVDITFRVLESAYAKNLFYFLLGHHFPSSFQHVERETECKKPGCKVQKAVFIRIASPLQKIVCRIKTIVRENFVREKFFWKKSPNF